MVIPGGERLVGAAEDEVVLVDGRGLEIGAAGKLSAHREGKLHRAFSVFVFGPGGEWLLQRRAKGKYHSGRLWSNTCCSHPRPGESVSDAAHRRLREEMGFDCPLRESFTFTYRVELPGGLTEHEFDHVLVGVYGSTPVPNPDEVDEWRWAAEEELLLEAGTHPERFTVWFLKALPRVLTRTDRGT